MNKQSNLWKYGLGLVLCAGCCALPILVGLGGFTAVAGILNSNLELLACLGLPLVALVAFAVNQQRKTKKSCQVSCAASCGCEQ